MAIRRVMGIETSTQSRRRLEMNRREIMSMVGATAAMTLAGKALADDDDKHEHKENDCCSTCSECAAECASCFAHCAEMLGKGKKEHAETMRLCNDCADICSVCAKVGARKGPMWKILCVACAESCDKCAAACEKFDDKHMKECAEECRECAQMCRAHAKTLK